MISTIKNRSSLDIQRAVVNALFLREMKTRFGIYKLGYFWAIAEPAAIIVVFWVMIGFHMRGSMPGIDYPMFLMTGMVPWNLFSSIVKRSASAFQSNRGLFNYRQVKPIDTLIARALVECLVYFFVFVLFMIIGAMIGFDAGVDNLPRLVLVLGELSLFAFSLGLLNAVIGTFSENFPKVIGLIMRPLFFTSGIFFAVESVPEQFRWILLLNPLLHFLEKIRSAYFAAFDSPYTDSLYMLAWTVCFTVTALWLYVKLQNRIIAS